MRLTYPFASRKTAIFVEISKNSVQAQNGKHEKSSQKNFALEAGGKTRALKELGFEGALRKPRRLRENRKSRGGGRKKIRLQKERPPFKGDVFRKERRRRRLRDNRLRQRKAGEGLLRQVQRDIQIRVGRRKRPPAARNAVCDIWLHEKNFTPGRNSKNSPPRAAYAAESCSDTITGTASPPNFAEPWGS